MGGLVVTTMVSGEPLSGEQYTTFGPGDDVPEWAARQMGEHCFEGGVHPYPDEPDDVAEPASEREPGTEPPRKGPKASRDSWVAFAAEKDFDIPEDAKTRDEIVAAMLNAGVIEAK